MTVTAGHARRVHLVVHGGRPSAISAALTVVVGLSEHGIDTTVSAQDDEDGRLEAAGVRVSDSAPGTELVLVFGGDGTMLRAADTAITHGVGLLGVNLGRVGFLAEAEVGDLERVVEAIVTRSYTVEPRMCVHVAVHQPDESVWESWALNEVSVSRVADLHVLELLLEIDNEPLSRFGADGLIVSTATGSTAYAFSAGGPVMWPQVEAMCVVPVSAHALFSRPLVVAPTSVVTISNPYSDARVSADSRRGVLAQAGSRTVVTRNSRHVNFVRIHESTFTDRLVRKFRLPVQGWRVDADGN